MKKTITIMLVGMFVLVGCGSIVYAEDEDPKGIIGVNGAPYAPVFIEDTGHWEKECYKYSFYAEDPDGDKIFFDISWTMIDEPNMITCSPDNPETPWLGPYDSGEQLEQTHNCYKTGNYELTIRAKDIYDHIGPSTTITVSYKESKFVQLFAFSQFMEKFPSLFNLLAKIF